MKKALKIILSIIGIVLLCLMILGQIAKYSMNSEMEETNLNSEFFKLSTAKKSEFARMIERADRDCPIPVAMGKGEITSIKLEDGFVTYYLSYDQSLRNVISGLNDKRKVKEGLLMSFLCTNAQGNNQGNLIMDLLIRFNYGLRIVITESANGAFECSATVDEIKSLRKRYQLNPHEALYNLLSLSIESERENLPMEIGEGMVMQDYLLDSDNIVIVITVDEDIYSVEEMYNNSDLIKVSMIEEGINNAESKALLDLCKVSHTGLVYRIIGNQTLKEFDVEISSDDICRFVQTPDVVNIQ